jgi:glycosyltransferase involved in cell wall biosynthesis
VVFVDALYINISGGKVLLDYIIEEFNRSEIDVFYLFDSRIKGKHPAVKDNNFEYLDASLLARHRFYKKNISRYSRVLCFGNLPPSIKLPSTVYTYFHQPLFIDIRKEIPFIQKFKLRIKTFIISRLVSNTDYWLVQSDFMKNSLEKKFGLESELNIVKIVPFYPPILQKKNHFERKKQLVYISNGETHKNHVRLLEAFTQFYDNYQGYELHLTVEKKFESLYKTISGLREKGYSIVNHEYLDRERLGQLYRSSEFLIYPSLAESFGLGILEALESGCKVIGADLPYMHAVCIPSLLFNPESVPDIILSLNKIISGDIKPSKQLVFNEIEELVNIFKQ